MNLRAQFYKILPNKKRIISIADFKKVKVIGKGGFSKVFMVRKKDSGLLYAMKCVKKEGLNDPNKLNQLLNERQIMT